MRYVFLAYKDERQSVAMSARERAALDNECAANEQDLWQSGHLLAVEDLHTSHTAITVRVVNGMVSVTDSPVAKAQGQLIRLFFINARDLNEAIQIAVQMPQVRIGLIEVRSIVELNQQY